MSLRKDYYKVLGVDKSVGDRELKRAYRDLAKQFHPDKVSRAAHMHTEVRFLHNFLYESAGHYVVLMHNPFVRCLGKKRRRWLRLASGILQRCVIFSASSAWYPNLDFYVIGFFGLSILLSFSLSGYD